MLFLLSINTFVTCNLEYWRDTASSNQTISCIDKPSIYCNHVEEVCLELPFA